MIDRSDRPRYASAISSHPQVPQALGEVVGDILEHHLASPNFALFLVSPVEPKAFSRIASVGQTLLGAEKVAAVMSDGPVGIRLHLEDALGLSILATDHDDFEPYLLPPLARAGSLSAFLRPTDSMTAKLQSGDSLALLADPFTFDVAGFIEFMNLQYPGVTVAGGEVSTRRSRARFTINDRVQSGGALAIRIPGAHVIGNPVAQGARVVGTPMVVTASRENEILELGYKSALTRLEELISSHLDPADLELLSSGALSIGRVVHEYASHYRSGDFLISRLINIAESTGSILAYDPMPMGSTVQFHLIDRTRAERELSEVTRRANSHNTQAGAALMFCGNGRGSHLFSTPNFEPVLIGELLGDVPLAGSSVRRTIGRLGNANYLLPQATSMILLRD